MKWENIAKVQWNENYITKDQWNENYITKVQWNENYITKVQWNEKNITKSGFIQAIWIKYKDFSRTSKDYLTVFKD